MNDNSSETNPIQDDGVKKAFASVNRSEAGAALIIVLAFIMMLLVLLLAFFSKSTQQQQISKSSSTIDLADIFAQGAADTIIGDLKQEIVAGSIATNIITTGIVTVTNTIYYPSTNSLGAAVGAVPQLVGCTTNPNAQLPNLVKISTNQPFYSLTNSNGVVIYGTNRASISSSTNPSYNGRYISAARWNKPLLLPVTATNDYTPPTAAGFVPPNWIFVERNGSNPTNNASTNLSTNMLWSTTNPNTVIGRYAYAVYNEGGLLDANVAGFPPALTNSSLIPTNLSPAYKEGAYFADLTQIGMTPMQITNLVGWRNYASSRNSGNFPSYTIPGYGTNYASNALANTNGFLSVATNSVVLGANTITDRQFTSRQQLISFLINADPSSTNTFTALQSLATFTRSLEQPSYQPPTKRPLVVTGPINNPSLNGGNDAGGSDNDINPSFLTIRVTNSFTRTNSFIGNDRTQALVGEPLVKQRFPLNRLAWITYKGPSATLYQSSPNDPVILAYLSNGISLSLLTNGTASNIMSCFGLYYSSKQGGFWTYSPTHATNGTGTINRIATVAALTGNSAREPDFFELLKAAESVGAIAKTSTAGTNADTHGSAQLFNPLNLQCKRDSAVNYAIIQEGANIIDQFDPDSFPTRISYDDGNAGPIEFRGVEDLPYIYRIRIGTITMANPTTAGSIFPATWPPKNYTTYQHSVSNTTTPFPMSLTNSGAGAILALPEVWNPHDVTEAPSVSSLVPTQFRITAQSTLPGNPTNFISAFVHNQNVTQEWSQVDNNGTVGTPAMNGIGTGGSGVSDSTNGLTTTRVGKVIFPGGYNHLNDITTNTGWLSFSYPTNTLYREPTLLAEANKPALSALSMSCYDANFDSVISDKSGLPAFTNGAITTTQNALNKIPTSYGNQYVGLFLALYPEAWVDTGRSAFMPVNTTEETIPARQVYLVASTVPAMDYLLQYQDPSNSNNWITYDEKYADLENGVLDGVGNNDSARAPLSYSAYSGRTNDTGGLLQHPFRTFCTASYTDPRTARFGAPIDTSGTTSETTSSNVVAMPPLLAPSSPTGWIGWMDQTNNVLASDRPDYFPGFGAFFAGGGITSFAAPGWSFYNITKLPSALQFGLLSQNSPDYPDNGMQFQGDTTKSTIPSTFYTDADGVVRRAMGGYVTNAQSSTPVGLPMASAMTTNNPMLSTPQAASRPRVLNRPFRSVGELGYVFSGTPWRNIDFFTPESGHSALLDVFCINPTSSSTTMSAGKVNLNTRQTNVLAAILSGGYRDESNPTNPNSLITSIDATNMATNIISFTSTNPLVNVTDLVGRWSGGSNNTISGMSSPQNIDGAKSYVGISSILSNAISTNSITNSLIQRFREAPIRALGAAGQTRVWNLLIDVVAQTGKYPPSAKGLDNFMVEGETRYWVHVAIDRLTGQILDKQVEVVKE